jgi:hypothetical protein
MKSVPLELRKLKRWIVWDTIRKKKVPLTIGGVKCDAFKNQNSFAAVKHFAKVGFVLDEPYCGIDLDNCIGPDGVYAEWAVETLEKFKGIAYSEISPSGKGIKLWIKARKPKGCPQDVMKLGEHEGIQVWDSGRWFAVTGEVVPGYETIAPDAQKELDWLVTHKNNKVEAAHQAIAKIPIGEDENDGSHRMFSYCRQAKRFCKDRWVAIKVVQDALVKFPTPTEWTEDRIAKEIDRCEVKFGEALDEPPQSSGKTEVSVSSQRIGNQIPEIVDYTPFPVDILPSPLREYVKEVASAIPCDPVHVVLPLLSGLAASIGNALVLEIKPSWKVPSILWTVLVAPSGSVKSAPPKLALRPLQEHQAKMLMQYDIDYAKFEDDKERYDSAIKSLKSGTKNVQIPMQPIEPVCSRIIVNDSTIEALAKRLADNPRGLMALYDELSGWLGSFNRYSSGTDESKWLEMYGAQTMIVDRASVKRPLYVERASVSLFGGIQPAILRKCLTADYKASGMAARLLFAMPPRKIKQWTDYEIDQMAEADMASVFAKILAIDMQVDCDGKLFPGTVRLDPLAKKMFIEYFNRHNLEQRDLSEDLWAAYAKLEETAARLALIIHTINIVYTTTNIESLYTNSNIVNTTTNIYTLDTNSMEIGIQLCEWFKAEAKRVYAVLSESEVENKNRDLLRWLASHESGITPRDFYRGNRSHFENVNEAEKLLQTFVSAELGTWQDVRPGPTGGRPTRMFVLSDECQQSLSVNVLEGAQKQEPFDDLDLPY